MAIVSGCKQIGGWPRWTERLSNMRKLRLPVFVIACLCIKYPIRIINHVWVGRNCSLKSGCEVKIPALLLTVKVMADLRGVIATIGVFAGFFDVDNMQVFGDIC